MDRFYYIYLWVAYNCLDVITTHIGFMLGHEEGNPIPAQIVAGTSPSFLPIYKLGVAALWLLAVLWLAGRYPRVIVALRLGNILVFGAVFWNILLIGSGLS